MGRGLFELRCKPLGGAGGFMFFEPDAIKKANAVTTMGIVAVLTSQSLCEGR